MAVQISKKRKVSIGARRGASRRLLRLPQSDPHPHDGSRGRLLPSGVSAGRGWTWMGCRAGSGLAQCGWGGSGPRGAPGSFMERFLVAGISLRT